MRLFPLCLLVVAMFAGCSSGIEGLGDPVEESRALLPFEVVALQCSADVELHQLKKGERPKVVVRAEENLLPFIVTELDDAKLLISFEENFRSPAGVTIEVHVAVLSKIISQGSGDIVSRQTLKLDDLEVVNQGSGDVVLKIRTDELEVTNQGSGNVVVAGKGETIDIEAQGSGDVKALDFKAESATVENDGSGNVSVYARDEMDVTINGSGDVKYLYKGSAEDMERTTNGSGQMVELTND